MTLSTNKYYGLKTKQPKKPLSNNSNKLPGSNAIEDPPSIMVNFQNNGDNKAVLSSNDEGNNDSSYDDSDLDQSYKPEKHSKHLNIGHTNYQSLGCPPSKVKRTLFGQLNHSIDDIESLSSPHARNKKSSVARKLSAGFQDKPFKPSTLIDNDILEIKSSERSYKTSAIYNTSSSPFKVSSPENHQIFTPTVHKEISAFSAAGNSSNENLLKKILGMVLKIRYDLETVAQRQNELEKIMSNQSQWKDGQALFEDQVDEFEFCVPITNGDSLNDFEQKLATSQSFKSNVVNGLRRLSRKTLASTVRQMLCKLFDDKFLTEYSYVGQKKKRSFLHWEHVLSFLMLSVK
uniref:DUF4806 domain-containing protein n=1 Tax=Schizaphis graminum TaxID=13262 RepID=A0A2S2P7Z2_SCHGA